MFIAFICIVGGMLSTSSPTAKDRSTADLVLEGLPERPALLLEDGEVVILPAPISRALSELLRMVAAGYQPVVLQADRMLTTSEAADLLGMSRQAVADLCDQGKIAHIRVGKHRRLPLENVLSHRAARIARKESELKVLSGSRGPTLDEIRSLGPRIREIVERHGASNIRVFGSVSRGEANPESDVDLLVDVPRGTTLIDLARLEDELDEALPWRVDVVTSGAVHGRMEHVELEAVPL